MVAPPPTPPSARAAATRILRDSGRLLVAGAIVAIAYVVLLDYRLDAAGHFAAGYGLALCVAAVMPIRQWPHRVAVAVLLTLWAGLIVEDNFFGSVIFDWFDVGNQTVGAALAGCVLLGAREGSEVPGAVRAVAGGTAICAGVLLSMGPGYLMGVLR